MQNSLKPLSAEFADKGFIRLEQRIRLEVEGLRSNEIYSEYLAIVQQQKEELQALKGKHESQREQKIAERLEQQSIEKQHREYRPKYLPAFSGQSHARADAESAVRRSERSELMSKEDALINAQLDWITEKVESLKCNTDFNEAVRDGLGVHFGRAGGRRR